MRCNVGNPITCALHNRVAEEKLNMSVARPANLPKIQHLPLILPPLPFCTHSSTFSVVLLCQMSSFSSDPTRPLLVFFAFHLVLLVLVAVWKTCICCLPPMLVTTVYHDCRALTPTVCNYALHKMPLT